MSAAQADLFGDDECEYDLSFIMENPIPAICIQRKWRECRDAESIRAPRLDNVRCFYCGGELRPLDKKAYQERVASLWLHKGNGNGTGRVMKDWKKEQNHVAKVFPDAQVIQVEADYEAFHAIVDGVRMIFYPHTVKGTRNQHLRVRNGTPQKKQAFLRLATILQHSKSPSCTFHVNNFWPSYSDADRMRGEGTYAQYWQNADHTKTAIL